MAGVNLASFKVLRKKYNEATKNYDDLRTNSFHQEGYLMGDSVILWDAMWGYSNLYDDLETLEIEIKQQLRACSDLKNRNEYEDMVSEIEYLKSNCISDYKEIKSALGEFGDSELRSMEEFRIDRL